MNFKQNDTKALRSKSLLNEIESVYDEVRPCPSVSGRRPGLCARFPASPSQGCEELEWMLLWPTASLEGGL